MASGYFQVERSLATQLKLRLGGEIDEETVLGCERETRMRLALVARESLEILWDLRDVQSYTFEARIVLVRLQRYLAEKATRTVYVAAELAARSLAVWAARMGGHGRLCLTADLGSAMAWLAGETGPTTGRFLIEGAYAPVPALVVDCRTDKAAG
jgi:hypothetical protein